MRTPSFINITSRPRGRPLFSVNSPYQYELLSNFIKITFIIIQYFENNSTKNILNYKPEGRINIGRPLTRWEDDFREEGIGQGP